MFTSGLITFFTKRDRSKKYKEQPLQLLCSTEIGSNVQYSTSLVRNQKETTMNRRKNSPIQLFNTSRYGVLRSSSDFDFFFFLVRLSLNLLCFPFCPSEFGYVAVCDWNSEICGAFCEDANGWKRKLLNLSVTCRMYEKWSEKIYMNNYGFCTLILSVSVNTCSKKNYVELKRESDFIWFNSVFKFTSNSTEMLL